MDSERSIIEGGASAATCTCGEDLGRNYHVHNYACPMTLKCPHIVTKRDPRTGETIQAPCGSRLEPQYVSHSVGCPCLSLCPHCGTTMDRRGVHSIGCPNRSNYSFEIPLNSWDGFLDDIRYLRRPDPQHNLNFPNIYERLLNFMREIPVIPPRRQAPPPSIIDGDFKIEDECQCSICHDSCDSSQRVLKPAGCDHCFHENCLTPWIQDHSTCPNCRSETQTILRKN